MSFNPSDLVKTGNRPSRSPFYYVYTTGDSTGTIQSTSGYFNGGNLRVDDVIRVIGNDAIKMYRVTDDSIDIGISIIETL